MQLLGWAMDRGSLVLPLTRGQFLAVYALPITPAEGALPPLPADAACLLPRPVCCRLLPYNYLRVQPAATCVAHQMNTCPTAFPTATSLQRPKLGRKGRRRRIARLSARAEGVSPMRDQVGGIA